VRAFATARGGLVAAGLMAATAGTAAAQAPRPAAPPAPRSAPAASVPPSPTVPAAPGAPAAASAAAAPKTLTAAIDDLGKLDYAVRTAASAAVRRAPAEQAVPALMNAVSSHADGYVRFRALVLLAGIGDPRTRDVMIPAIDDANDRLREVAYAWLEANPEPPLAPKLMAKLETEMSEFVRPSLVRALAALGSDPKVQAALLKDVTRGEDIFRSAVIEALGLHKASYAVPALSAIAALEGPLQDDAVVALARIGDPKGLEIVIAQQGKAPRARQPALAAAICLLGRNCDSHERFLSETLVFTTKNLGHQELARSAAEALGVLARSGRASAWDALIAIGDPSVDPVRAPIALAAAGAAVGGDPAVVLGALERASDPKAALLLLRDGFDMLSEDFAEERFYARLRALYWQAPAGSPVRTRIQRVMTALDF
jgi:HEAT repeat protein